MNESRTTNSTGEPVAAHVIAMAAPGLRLSEREKQILNCLLVCRDDDSAIAQALQVSKHTVHTYMERLYKKLGVSSRCQVVAKVLFAYATMAGDTVTRGVD